jgi:hypothetical protein
VFQDHWLATRTANRAFSSAALLALAFIPFSLGYVNISEMQLAGRLFSTVLAVAAIPAQFFLWFGMWRYWQTLDSSGRTGKRAWFAVLLFGLWWGSCLYFLLVYRRQLGLQTLRRSPQAQHVLQPDHPMRKVRTVLVGAWALFWAPIAVVFLIQPKPGIWLKYLEAAPVLGAVLFLFSLAYCVLHLYRTGVQSAHGDRPQNEPTRE